MTNISKKIVWEKWKDPYNEEDNWFPEEKESENELYLFDTEGMEDMEEEGIPKALKLLLSNVGAPQVDPNAHIYRMFNFWTGHTSFSITAPIATRIEKIEGIEVLDILTRYRFRVGIAKLFRDREVMSAIQEVICEY